MGVVIGIDVGGSTTKIVGFRMAENQKRGELIHPLFVRATDPLTSIYGAFGKFTDLNGLSLSDVDRVMMTGVGSSAISRGIYDLPLTTVSEFRSNGLGGLYLSGLDRAIVVSMGTGTSLVYAEEGKEPVYLGGTGIGGGTLMGLSRKLLGMDTVAHVDELASTGDLSRVDLRVGDITKAMKEMPGHLTAANFGKVNDLTTKADVAAGLFNMVFETVGMMAIFAARSHGIKDIVLTGNLTAVSLCKPTFENLSSLFDVQFIIPENSQFGTVIGSALCGCN